MAESVDVVVVGAGMVGAACAYELASAGLSVAVLDRGPLVGGTTGAGEGNILVSDKAPGPELELALLSDRLWRGLAEVLPPQVDLEAKGGLVVAPTAAGWEALRAGASAQRDAGVAAVEIAGDDLASYEPHLAPGLPGGVSYQQDQQVNPMLAAAHLLRLAARAGAVLHAGTEVTAVCRSGSGRITGVRTTTREIGAGTVVNAAGSWSGEVAALAGAPIPVLPRRGFVLVTEPLPLVVHHKVYSADYVANVAASSEGLETSTVIEGTGAGPVLIGASRERVGYDRTVSYDVLSRLARQAVRLFPALAGVRAQRAYLGFRPYCPDHLPVIGADPRVPGLVHACGHEGAGIGLAPATAALVTATVIGTEPALDLTPFSPLRFPVVA